MEQTKNDEVREDFAQTEAYSIIFMELATEDKAASDFIKGVMPSDLADKVDGVDPDKIKEELGISTNSSKK